MSWLRLNIGHTQTSDVRIDVSRLRLNIGHTQPSDVRMDKPWLRLNIGHTQKRTFAKITLGKSYRYGWPANNDSPY